MEYSSCEICGEVFFTDEDAKTRHQQMCVAIKGYLSCRKFEKYGGSSSRPLKQQRSPSPQTSNKRAKTLELKLSTLKTQQPSSSTLPYTLTKGLSSARDYRIENNGSYQDIEPFLDEALKTAATILQDELHVSKSVKYNVVFEAVYNHPSSEREMFNFKTSSRTLFSVDQSNVQEHMEADKEKLINEESELQEKNSGWSFEYPSSLTVRVSRFKYKTPKGSAYIELPKRLSRRKATINVHNRDDLCFKYAVLTKHLVDSDLNKTLTEQSFSELEHVYRFDGLTFPMSLEGINRFCKLNTNTSVNVFECGPDCNIVPARVVDELEDHIDLLHFTNANGNSHYIYITDFAKLIKPQITKGTNAITICKRCSTFNETRKCKPDAKTWLEEHTRLCKTHEPTQLLLPKEGNDTVKFEEFETQIPVPIIVIADFESTLVPTVGTDGAFQIHEPNSFCTLIKSTFPQEVLEEVGIDTTPRVHLSQTAGRDFLLHLEELAKKVEALYTRQVALGPMTQEQKDHHEKATCCDLCERSFNDTNNQKVIDHCHCTGEYRFTLCSRCNLRAQRPNFIPVYTHNGSRYDNFFIMKSLSALPNCEVKVIPSTTEKYIAIMVRVKNMWLRFLDSFRLLPESLSKLTETLSDQDFVESSKLVDPDQVELIKRKGVYPYDWVTSPEVFSASSLPSREAFYSSLGEEHISEQDYAFALSVWNKLKMKTFLDYHTFYLKLDTCLLADVIQTYRSTCLETYKIDCCHHYTSPGLSYKSMLRMSRVTLELIKDADQMMMVESGIRGGLVQSCLRYAKANNPYLSCPNDYKSEEPTSYLLFLDAVSLYASSMRHAMPTGNFKFVEDPESLDWSTLPGDSPTGYIIEADVSVPDSVHTSLQDLPPLPEQAIPPGGKTKKLLATLNNKERYVAYYTVFQQAVALGLKVTKIHRALSFTQSPFIKQFVERNAELRAQSTNEFYKKTWKLISNATFGKTLMNKRKQRIVKIVTTQHAFEKLCRQPHFAERVVISENVVAVHMHKRSVTLNSPVQIGLCILDTSKIFMQRFFHNVLREHFKAPDFTLTLAYMDTDSLAMKIEQHGKRALFDVLRQPSLVQHLDQSSYPPSHPLKNDTNKGKLGFFKDEAKNGMQIYEWCSLRSKLYAYRYSSSENEAKSTLKAKGIKTQYVTNNLTFKDYKNALFSQGENVPVAEYNLIQSKNFTLKTKTVRKITLSADDDKRHILPCGIKTLPHGHYLVRGGVEREDSGESSNESQD